MEIFINEAAMINSPEMEKYMRSKLVRSKIAKKIKKEEPENLKTIAFPALVFPLLLKKLDEELNELRESDFTDPYEYADVLEVLETIMKQKKISKASVQKAKAEKLRKFGNLDLTSLYIKH